MDIGEKLRNARKLAKLTQEQLAQKSGVAAVTIRQYESGKHQPRLEQLSALSRALEISLLYFLDDPKVSHTLEQARADYRAWEKEQAMDRIVENLLEEMYGKRTEKLIGRNGITHTLSIYGTGKDAVSISGELFMAISGAIQGAVKPLVRYLALSPEEDEREFLEGIPKIETYLQEGAVENTPTHDASGQADL